MCDNYCSTVYVELLGGVGMAESPGNCHGIVPAMLSCDLV